MKIKAFVLGTTIVLFFAGQSQAQEPLARAFIEAVRNNNSALLKQWSPTPALVRVLEPARTKGMSDTAIKQKYLAPLQKKLANDFANFHASAQQSSIDVSKLRYENFQLHRDNPNAPNKPLACSIHYSYGDKQGTFTITVLERQKKWIIFEVLLSVDIFAKLK